MIRDFSKCARSEKYYAGAGRKIGITLNGKNYIIKFRRKSPYGLTYSHVSEYLGSHIFDLFGIIVQDTWLGTYCGEEVVAVKDFISDGEIFAPFDDMSGCCIDVYRNCAQYEYGDIMNIMRENIGPDRIEEAVDTFWDMFIIDAFTGNVDRRGRNWGFIRRGGKYRIAPVFGNDSCLFPEVVTDEQCRKIMSSEEEMEHCILQFSVPQVKWRGKKSSFYEIIASHKFPECDRALWRVIKKIDFSGIQDLVWGMDGLSDLRKIFLLQILEERYKKFLLEPFERRL